MKKHYHILLLLVLLLAIIATNARGGTFIMGLDNYAPYFGIRPIVDKLTGNDGILFISFAPLLFVLPFFSALSAIGIPEWALSQVFLFVALLIGITGSAALTQFILAQKNSDSRLMYLTGGIFYLTTLFTFWIFNQPNFLFVAGYASIPWVVLGLSMYFTTHPFRKTPGTILLTITTAILFFVTSLNLVAFLSYTVSVLLISCAVTILKNHPIPWRKVLAATAALFLSWLTIMQVLLIVFGHNMWIGSALARHMENIQENQMTQRISNDLRASAQLRNTFTNIVSFSGGWMETHDHDNVPLFQHYSLYNTWYMKFIGLLPFIIALLTLRAVKSKSVKAPGQALPLHVVLFTGILLTSKLFLVISGKFQILETAFRWPESKFWPLTVIPLFLLASLGIQTTVAIQKTKWSLLLPLCILIQCLYFFPAISGGLFSPQLTVAIPDEYGTVSSNINSSYSDNGILYLPPPEDLYFYSYPWGYFGSDFLGYMTRGNYINTGPLSFYYNTRLYEETEDILLSCDPDSGTKMIERYHFNMVLLDRNLSDEEYAESVHSCLVQSGFHIVPVKEAETLTLYEFVR